MCESSSVQDKGQEWFKVPSRREKGHRGAGCGVVASMMRTRTPPGGVSSMDGPESSQDSELGDLLALLHCTKMALRPRLDHLCRCRS